MDIHTAKHTITISSFDMNSWAIAATWIALDSRQAIVNLQISAIYLRLRPETGVPLKSSANCLTSEKLVVEKTDKIPVLTIVELQKSRFSSVSL
jgi:hypothetical protein